MKIFLLVTLLPLLFCCKSKISNEKTTSDSIQEIDTKKITTKKIASIKEKPGKRIIEPAASNNEDEYFVSKTIYKNILKFPAIIFQNPEDIRHNLHLLFPGNAFTTKEFGRTLHTVFWQMGYNLKNRRIPSTFTGSEYDIVFPQDVAWETRFEDSFYYEINSEEYFAMFFSSFGSCCDTHRSGRFACAIVGCVVFKKDPTGWVTTGYNPCIGCFGMFGNPHSPVKIQLNKKQYGFYITNGVQGAGTPYWSDIHFFKLDSNITPILQVTDYERANASLSSWGSKVLCEPGRDSVYSIIIKTKGFINYYDIDSFELESMHYLYKKLVSTKGNYKFWHTKTYTPDSNQKYKLAKEKFNYKSWKLDTINGNTYSRGSWFYDR